MSEKLYLTHAHIMNACLKMAERIACDFGSKHVHVYGIPRGGIPVAYLLRSMIPRMSIVSKPDDADLFVDDIIDSGKTRDNYEKKYDCPFYGLFNKIEDPSLPWIVFPWESTVEKSIEDAFVRLLQFIGEDPGREGLLDTPKRMAKAWTEWTRGYTQDPKEVFTSFKDGGEKYDEMVLVEGIPFYSHCEHHLAAIFGMVHIAYIPSGRIAGLSKFARLVDLFASRLQVQERLTTQIADVIEQELRPLGVAVYIEARHFCMESRGVKKAGSQTKTSAMRGAFRDNLAARNEFFAMVKK